MKAKIHQTAIIGENVSIGKGTIIEANAIIHNNVELGDNVYVGASSIIGAIPKIKGLTQGNGKTIVANGCRINEHCVIDAPSNYLTFIQEDAYIMPFCYIGHDAKLGKNVTLTAGCKLGGHVILEDNVTLGLNSVVHQYTVIGKFVMAGMGCVINKDVPPFLKVMGNPAVARGVNQIGLERSGFTTNQIEEIKLIIIKALSGETTWENSLFGDFKLLSKRNIIKGALMS